MSEMNHDIYNTEEDLLRYWELRFQTWNQTPDEYERLMNYMGEIFHTTFENRAPLQLVGNFWDRTAEVLIVNSVPQFIETKEYEIFEEKERELKEEQDRDTRRWMYQIRFAMQYFNLLRTYKLDLPYYQKLNQLVNYYKQRTTKETKQYETLHNYAVQANILPFYGKEVYIAEVNEIVTEAFARMKKFYLRGDYGLMVITDKELYETLSAGELLGPGEEQNEFTIGVSGLVQKGLYIDVSTEVENVELQRKAREIRKIVTWNREHYWKTM